MAKITLPLLEALDYLSKHNLIIDRLWTTHPDPDMPPTTNVKVKSAPTITTKNITGISNVYEYQQFTSNCVVCHKPKSKPGYTTCLDVPCLRAYMLPHKKPEQKKPPLPLERPSPKH